MEKQRKVFLMPKEFVNLDQPTTGEFEMVTLKCPRTGNAVTYFLDPVKHKLLEILQFREDKGSWFIDDSVEKDGSLYISTPIDALFLALPYLRKSKMFSPLDQLLVDTEFPDSKNLVQCCSETIDVITDSKDVGSTIVYRYNEHKALEWLQHKVKKVTDTLNIKGIDCSGDAKSTTLVQKKKGYDENNSLQVLIYAYGIVSEYLEEPLALRLSEALRIEDALQKANMEGCKENPTKKVKPSEAVEPSENYFEQFSYDKKAKKPAKLSANQKKLMKVDKTGMKNISSFFGAKSNKN